MLGQASSSLLSWSQYSHRETNRKENKIRKRTMKIEENEKLIANIYNCTVEMTNREGKRNTKYIIRNVKALEEWTSHSFSVSSLLAIHFLRLLCLCLPCLPASIFPAVNRDINIQLMNRFPSCCTYLPLIKEWCFMKRKCHYLNMSTEIQHKTGHYKWKEGKPTNKWRE